MDIIPENDVYTNTRNTKKIFLLTDFICVDCGAIFNSVYEDQCILCGDGDKEVKLDEHKEYRYKEYIHKEYRHYSSIKKCDHVSFITGKQSIDIRILLNFSADDIIALCDLHGCSTGSRSKMTINIMKKIYPYLDERINEKLIRKIIKRNTRKFWYIKDIDLELKNIKSKSRLKVIDASECIEVSNIKSLMDVKK